MPTTLLTTPITQLVSNPEKIMFILQKTIEEKMYQKILYEIKNDLLKEIKVKRGCIEVPNIDKKIVVIIQGNFSNGYIKYGIVLDIRK